MCLRRFEMSLGLLNSAGNRHPKLSGRDLGQDACGRHDDQAPYDRHHSGDECSRRHRVRHLHRAHWLARHRADLQHQPKREGPSLFEPIHGQAIDITGKGTANPVAIFWTTGMVLEHLGEKPAAERLMRAVERVTADLNLHIPDLGGKATTEQVTDTACKAPRQADNHSTIVAGAPRRRNAPYRPAAKGPPRRPPRPPIPASCSGRCSRPSSPRPR